MKKRIIIFGGANTGKTRLAKQMALAFDNPVFISGRKLNESRFPYEELESDNDLMIIDNVTTGIISLKPSFLVSETLIINKEIFTTPKTIITIECDEEFIDELPKAIKLRSIFIKCEADHSDTMPALQANRYYTQNEILNA
ncbi:hypothetical protein [Leeuwenhoekiella sp. CH_XMU1409-2]|uniref:hypothetical protein n=1 Tax=Leeuwenhoekiella sp. CH_XMU1409-2 TaxID=3107768 RepID=UPI003008F23A